MSQCTLSLYLICDKMDGYVKKLFILQDFYSFLTWKWDLDVTQGQYVCIGWYITPQSNDIFCNASKIVALQKIGYITKFT